MDPRAQVVTAAGAGSAAAIAINADLVEEDVRDAVHDFNTGHLPAMTNARPHRRSQHDDRQSEARHGDDGPPTKHQLALMIWLAVFPTLTVLNLALGDWLRTLTPVAAHLRARHGRRPDRHLRTHAALHRIPSAC